MAPLPFAYTTELVVVEFRGCQNKSVIYQGITFNYYSDLQNCKFVVNYGINYTIFNLL